MFLIIHFVSLGQRLVTAVAWLLCSYKVYAGTVGRVGVGGLNLNDALDVLCR